MKLYFSTFFDWIKWSSLIFSGIIGMLQKTTVDFSIFFNDWLAFCISILLAAVANIAFFSRENKITIKFIFRQLVLSFFVGWISFLIAKNFNLSFEIKLVIVSIMAFLAEFFLKWLSEKYPKIFDRGLDKIFPINNSEDNE